MYALACVDEVLAKSSSCIEDVQGMLDSLGMNHSAAFVQGLQIFRWYLQGRGIEAR